MRWQFSIIQNQKIISSMNGSLSYKSASLRKPKESPSPKSTISFQTLYKSRNDHTILKHINISKGKSGVQTEAAEQLETGKQAKIKLEHEMKGYVKSLRKPLGEGDGDRGDGRDGDHCGEQPEMSKSQSQPLFTLPRRNTEDQSPTLDTLQKKVQQLLQLKLLRKSQNKSTLSLRTYEDELQRDLESLISQIQQYSELGENRSSDTIDQQIKQITQKIGILERVIAESWTESEMLKKYYFMKKVSRKPFAIFEDHIRRESALQEAVMVKNRSFVPQHPSFHFTSISHSSYTKPQRQAYEKLSKSSKNATINRQSIGRSSYQADYLNYGALPIYPVKKDMEGTLSMLNVSENKSSIYQADFKEKKATLIDSKGLDCRRDKFKPTPITFMPRKMIDNKQNPNPKSRSRKSKLPKHKIIYQPALPTPAAMSYSSIYKDSTMMRNSEWLGTMSSGTEYKTNFSGHKAIIECLAKETNLNSLKYEFRKNFNA